VRAWLLVLLRGGASMLASAILTLPSGCHV
jgi:hypothetical protein